jgi:hypothetical protein
MNISQCDTYAPAKVANSNPERFAIFFWDSKAFPRCFSSTDFLSEADFRAELAKMGHTPAQIEVLVANCCSV